MFSADECGEGTGSGRWVLIVNATRWLHRINGRISHMLESDSTFVWGEEHQNHQL